MIVLSSGTVVLLACLYRGERGIDTTSERWARLDARGRVEEVWEMRDLPAAREVASIVLATFRAERADDVESLWRSGAWHWWQAEGEGDPARRRFELDTAELFLSRAVARDATSAEANYYAALVAFERARDAGWSPSARETFLEPLRRAFRVDPGVEGGGPYALLGLYYLDVAQPPDASDRADRLVRLGRDRRHRSKSSPEEERLLALNVIVEELRRPRDDEARRRAWDWYFGAAWCGRKADRSRTEAWLSALGLLKPRD
jgi:hypothetical protein